MEMVVHFTLTGEHFTSLVRNLMLEDEPGKALRLLTKGLLGDESHHLAYLAQGVLDGTHRLEGNEKEMDFVEDNTPEGEAYRTEVKRFYLGRFRHQGQWYRPVAEVTTLGTEDGNHACRKSGPVPVYGISDKERTERWCRSRVEYYASEDEEVFTTVHRGYIICKACGEPPQWQTPCRNATDALEILEGEGFKLEERGWEPPEEEEDLPTYSEKVTSFLRPTAPRDPEEEARKEREREEENLRTLEGYRSRVLEQAQGDTMEISTRDGKFRAEVPTAPFLNYALGKTTLRHLAPPWENVSSSGVKQGADNPDHTDWWLGAKVDGVFVDLSLDYDYEGPLHSAAIDTLLQLQRTLGNFPCGVLVEAHGEELEGVVGEDIAVLPDIHPSRMETILNSRAVVTEAGGQGAHMAQMAVEWGIPMFYLPNARTLFPEGSPVRVNPKTGTVTLVARDHCTLIQ
jgi:phosphohistidine swiveling domain-containing protein